GRAPPPPAAARAAARGGGGGGARSVGPAATLASGRADPRVYRRSRGRATTPHGSPSHPSNRRPLMPNSSAGTFRRAALAALACAVLAGCSSMNATTKGTLIGAGAGAVTGGVIGNQT